MKRIALKTYAKIVAFLMSILGFIVGCGDSIVEYGVPSADFVAKGKVVDKATNQPIPNIQIVGKEDTGGTNPLTDTVFTKQDGTYTLEMNKVIGFPVKIYAEDVDGSANGLFAPDSMQITNKDVDRIKKGDGWYSGMYEKKDANFSLKKSVATPLYGVPSADYKEKETK